MNRVKSSVLSIIILFIVMLYPIIAASHDNIDFYYVQNYGAVADGSTDDLVAIQSAIDAAPPYSTVVVPQGPSFYRLDNSSASVQINKPLNVFIRGHLKSTNPYKEIFVIQSTADVNFVGRGGRIEGPGVYDFAGSSLNGMLMFDNVASFSVEGIYFHEIPSIGIRVDLSSQGEIFRNHFVGGHAYISGSGATGNHLYGVLFHGSTGLNIHHNQGYPNASGGSLYSVIDGNQLGSIPNTDITISHNTFRAPLEHGIYVAKLTDSNISDNIITYDPNRLYDFPGPGIKIEGQRNTIHNNTIRNSWGGIQARNAEFTTISQNKILGMLSYLAIGIYRYGVYYGTYNHNKILDNIIIGADGNDAHCGIYMSSYTDNGYTTIEGLEVRGNKIMWINGKEGQSYEDGISIAVGNPGTLLNAKIVDNHIENVADNGIKLLRAVQSTISRNTIKNTGMAAHRSGSSGIWLYYNAVNNRVQENTIVKSDQYADMLDPIRASGGSTDGNEISENSAFGF